ncbi:MAG: tRNA-specific adenosine deaminase [Elusimicrobia bacterium ADurb.Bin231]|nr:MAG: tRNA-specific adenosine deaminase [Elusimicrobia bacterium ADurb.Bin231]
MRKINLRNSDVADEFFMNAALLEARKAELKGEVPVGCVVVSEGRIISRGHNLSISLKDPTAHAEIIAIKKAAKALKNYRLTNCSIYVTIEPCPMCAGAIVWARIKKLCFGASDSRTGSCGSILDIVQNNSFNHNVEVKKGVLRCESKNIITNFFKIKRTLNSSRQKK